MTQQIFSGREAELRQLRSALYNLLNGASGEKRELAGRVILVEGESGVGKTSLIRRYMETWFQEDDFYHAFIACQRNEGLVAYKSLNTILMRLNEQVNTLGRKSAKGFFNFMQEVSPKWISLIPVFGGITAATIETAMIARQQFGKAEKSLEVSSEAEIIEIYDTELRKHAAEKPLVLLFDDIQWMDMASAGALLKLIRLMVERPYNVLFVMSSTETGSNDIASKTANRENHSGYPFSAMLEQFAGDESASDNPRWFEKISLEPFSVKEIEGLLELWFPKNSFKNNFAVKLHAHTHGQARFITEIIEMKVRKQDIREEAGSYKLVSDTLENLPATVGSAINARLGMLGKNHQRLLAYASVSGHDFEAQVVGKVLNFDELELLDYIDDLSRNYNLLSAGSTMMVNSNMIDHYNFIDQFTHRHIYENMDYARRRALHRRIAEIMQETYGDLISQDRELKNNWLRHRQIGAGILDGISGKVIMPAVMHPGETLVKTYMEAAANELDNSRFCQANFAMDEAIGHADKALEFIRYAEDDSADYSGLLFLILSGKYMSYDWKGMYAEAEDLAYNMVEVAHHMGDAEKQSEALIRLGRAQHGRGNPDKAQKNYEMALERLGSEGDRFIKARIYNRMGMVADAFRKYDEAIGYYLKAAEINNVKDYEADYGANLLNAGISCRKRADFKKASEYFEKARILFESVGMKHMIAAVLNQVGLLFLTSQDFSKAQDHFTRALEIDKQTNNHKARAEHLLNLGRLFSDQKDEKAALECYEESLGLYYLTGDSQAQANVNASMAQSWLELAELPKAENCIIKALRIVESLPNQSNLAWVLGNYGDFLMAAGKNDEALDQYKKALAINSASGEQMAITGDYIRLASFYKAEGNRKEMQHYINLGLKYAEDCNNHRDIEKLKSIGR